MISKELLSEVLGEEVGKVCEASKEYLSFTNVQNDLLKVWINGNFYFLNLHQIAHKCKEWALNWGYEIHSNIGNNLSGATKGYYLLCNERNSKPIPNFRYTTSDTEPEAIFKACQWILDNKE